MPKVSFHTKVVLTGMVATSLAGCASTVDLVDPGKGIPAPLVTRDGVSAIHETQTKNGLRASFAMSYTDDRGQTGYELTVVFRNENQVPIYFTAAIEVEDKTGLELRPMDANIYMARAARMAGVQVPAPIDTQSSRTFHTGTVTSMSTGQTYSYSGTSGPARGFASGVASGAALGDGIAAAIIQRQGADRLQWAQSYWLRNEYNLNPGSSAVAALAFSAKPRPLPLTVTVYAGSTQFKFITKP